MSYDHGKKTWVSSPLKQVPSAKVPRCIVHLNSVFDRVLFRRGSCCAIVAAHNSMMIVTRFPMNISWSLCICRQQKILDATMVYSLQNLFQEFTNAHVYIWLSSLTGTHCHPLTPFGIHWLSLASNTSLQHPFTPSGIHSHPPASINTLQHLSLASGGNMSIFFLFGNLRLHLFITKKSFTLRARG